MAELNQNRIIAENISFYLEKTGKTQRQLARFTGVSQAAVSGWCKGLKVPRMDKIDKICNFFRINRFQLLVYSAESTQYLQSIPIPVLAVVRAGIPIDAQEEIIAWEGISPQTAFSGDFFGMQVRGDLMKPRFSENDLTIVRQQDKAESGDIVAVSIGSRDAVLLELMKYPDGGIALIPSNPLHPPLRFSGEEIEKRRVNIIGKVTELRVRF